MGAFDTVWDPDGGDVQVKCFGCCQQNYEVGDEVSLELKMPTWEGFDPAQLKQYAALRSYQVYLPDGRFLTVVDGRIFAFESTRRAELEVLDVFGLPWNLYKQYASDVPDAEES